MTYIRASLLILMISLVGNARGDPSRAPVTVLDENIVYDVNADGNYSIDEHARYQINTEQGVQTRSQLSLYYSASLQTLQIREAYTTTEDGTQIPVSPDRTLEQQAPSECRYNDVRR